MSNILSYPGILEVSPQDLLIISDISEEGKPTRTVTVQALVGGSTAPLSLVVNRTSGDATLINNVLNIPNYGNSGGMDSWFVSGEGGFEVTNGESVFFFGGTKITSINDNANQRVTFNHDVTTRNDTVSAVAPLAGASFTVVDLIEQDVTGHPIRVNVKTVTLPAGGEGGGVETITTTDGTYIDLTPNTIASGAVTVTADLSATGIGAPLSDYFLRGDNTWAIPPGGSGAVTSVDETTPGTSAGIPIIVNPTTGNVLVQSMAYAGTTKVGHVPMGGDTTTFLRGDGTWVTPSGGGTMSSWNVDDGSAGGFSVTNNDSVLVVDSAKILVATNPANKSITWTHTNLTRVDTTSTASPAAGATFTVVDSITQDATGHPTAVNVKTVTMPATGGAGVTYDLTSVQNGADVDITLTPSTGVADIVKLIKGSGITLTDSGNNITIDAAAGGSGVTSVGLGTPSAFTVTNSPVTGIGTLTFAGAGLTTDYIDGTGSLQAFPSIPVLPTDIVNTVTTTDGTFINLTPNAPVNGSVTVTADLSAIDGTDTSGLFLSKDNVWSTIPGGNVGTVTNVSALINGNAYIATVANPTASAAITISPQGVSTDYINGLGNLVPFPSIPTGSVTSIGLSTNIAAFQIANSPITSNGTLGLNLLGGSVGQFLKQDGTWATVPGGNVGTVTSVAASHAGTAFTAIVTDPTGAASIAINTNGGTATDYINGAGDYIPLNTLPSAGVTQIVAGTNVTVSPVGGTGVVTVNSTDQFTGTVTGVTGVLPITSSGGATPAIGINDYTGADGTTAGTNGSVPAPAATDNVKFLKGDGTWATPAGAGGVTSVDETTPGVSVGIPIVVDPTTGSALVKSMAYAGTTNVGHVPTGGDNTKFLRGDGTWVVPSGGTGTVTNVAYTTDISAFTANVTNPTGSPIITLNLNGGTAGQFLQQDGQWATPAGGTGTVTSITPVATTGTGTAITTIGDITFTGAGGIATSVNAANEVTITSTGGGSGGFVPIGTLANSDIYNANWNSAYPIARSVVIGNNQMSTDALAALEVHGRISVVDPYVRNSTFVGFESGKDYTGLGAGDNTGFGYKTLTANTDGQTNTAVGRSALTANTTGDGNTAIGHGSLIANTTGQFNTSVGQGAMNTNSLGNFNTCIGGAAMEYLLEHDNNVAVGYRALKAVRSDNNTAVGTDAGTTIVYGTHNVCLGYEAGSFSLGAGSVDQGNKNVFIGARSGLNTHNVEACIYIGYETEKMPFPPAGTIITNETVIGHNAVGKGTNTVVLGNDNVTETYLKGIVVLEGYTVTALPTAPQAKVGMRTYVTDALSASPTYGTNATGGGSAFLPVFYNGTDWIYA